MRLLDYHKNCKRVLSGEIPLHRLVKSARLACGKASPSTNNPIKAVAKEELKAFRQAAAAVVDRHLPTARDGTPASALPINRELLNFVSVATPNIRLRARAGSGKSTALRIKADFLVNALKVDPGQIQIVTFNTAAAESMAAELCKALGSGVGGQIRVNTFHSLAYHLVKSCPMTAASKLLFDNRDDLGEAQTNTVARSVKTVVTKDDLDRLRAIYSASEWGWMTNRPGFEGRMLDMLAKAALLYRTRRKGTEIGLATGVPAILERICMHLETQLAERHELDFEAAVRLAADLLASPDNRFDSRSSIVSGLDGNTRFLMVDEFQDFSPAFQRLTEAIMTRNPDCVLNAVGDDWQAINGFMGSDPAYFQSFRKDWAPALSLPLRANWRCGARIVTLGNEIMGAEGDTAAVPALDLQGQIRVPSQGNIKTEKRNRDAWQEEARTFVTEQLERQIMYMRIGEEKAGRALGSLALIASENMPYGVEPEIFVTAARREWTGGTVEFITAHRSKGLQWDHVILLDGIATRYPGKHPGNLLTKAKLTQADLDTEGQRLLYVAVTRAKNSLAILAPTELHPKLKAARALARMSL